MNFSKKGTVDKQKELRSTKRKMSVKAGVSIFRTFLVCIVMIVIIGVFAGFGVLKGIIDNAPSIESIQVAPSGFYTTIYDSKGKEIQRLIGSGANRSNKKLEEIPKVVQDAFIAIEDERFWEHNGIDIKGIFRAFFQGLANGGDFDQGASTITQQLLKNQVFEGGMEASFAEKLERKIQEQYLAIQLSGIMSKEQILEYYLNTINLGQNTLGVQTASKRYFNKNVEDLTLSEAAVIAAITKSPSNLNPITSPEKNAERRQLVLDNMKTQGYITGSQYKEAMADNVYERIQQVNEEQTTSTKVNSYFVDELIDQVMEDLQTQLGYTSTQAYNMIYQSGLSIYATQNTSLQKTCDKILKDESLYPANSEYELIYRLTVVKPDGEKVNYNELMLESYFQKKSPYFTRYFKTKKDAEPYIKEYRNFVVGKKDKIEGEVISYTIQPQLSFVLMDQSNGKVLSISGGRGAKTANRTLNRASDSVRQPGSTFKVVSTYLPALDTKGMTLATVKDDAPHNYQGTNTPIKNWYSGYKGLSTIRQGIYDSMNILTVKFLEDVTPQTAFSYLEKLGFTTLERKYVDENGGIHSDITYPMALGGLTKGVTNLELTAAFSSIANGGNYNKPIFYTKVLDHDGKVILDNTKKKSTQVMKPATAWLLTSAMQDVITRGTGTRARFQSVNMPVAGKSGTTTNDIDLWFVGYTPYYTAGIWGGYDNNKKQSDTAYVKNIWRTVMEKLHEKKERKEFPMPNTITTARICTKCGKLAVDGLCDRAAGGSAIRTEYFEKGTVPTSACDCHIKVQVCKASNRTPTKYCPKEELTEKVYLTKNETSVTSDTPNILPKDFEKKTCTVHTGPDEGIASEEPKPSKAPGTGGPGGTEPASSPAPPVSSAPPDPTPPVESTIPPES